MMGLVAKTIQNIPVNNQLTQAVIVLFVLPVSDAGPVGYFVAGMSDSG